jgi:4-carboxymuconolactone decarboxylase
VIDGLSNAAAATPETMTNRFTTRIPTHRLLELLEVGRRSALRSASAELPPYACVKLAICVIYFSIPQILEARSMERGHVDQDTYDRGREIRAAVLGEAYVAQATANADDFTAPLQDLVTEYCWGAVWGRDGLPLKTRSMLNLAMLAVLNRPNELRTHVVGALTNGVTREEIREIFLQVAIYGGVPAAVDSFRIARAAFDDIDPGPGKG